MSRLSSGPARVLSSGTATTWFGHGLDLAVDVDGRALRLSFAFAREGGPPRVETAPRPDGWSLRLVDLDEPGRGSAEPMLVGRAGDDLLFLHLRVLAAGASVDRTLHWTLFRVPAADVGWRPTDER